jgi:hypothetical protein
VHAYPFTTEAGREARPLRTRRACGRHRAGIALEAARTGQRGLGLASAPWPLSLAPTGLGGRSGAFVKLVMPQIASVVHGERLSNAKPASLLPPNGQSAALQRVGERLLAIANDPAVNWTDQGRMDARRAAIEMLQQAASVEMKGVGCLRP